MIQSMNGVSLFIFLLTLLCRSLLYILIFVKVWEIVAECEPHLDVDPVEVGMLIRYSFFKFDIIFVLIQYPQNSVLNNK
jgi:hypothetical protein